MPLLAARCRAAVCCHPIWPSAGRVTGRATGRTSRVQRRALGALHGLLIPHVLVDCCTVCVEFIRHVSILRWWFHLISKPMRETTRRRSGAGTIYITLYMIIRYTGNIFTCKCLERFAASQLHSSVEWLESHGWIDAWDRVVLLRLGCS